MKFLLDKNGIKIQQNFRPPTVYLDHWALCEFSENEEIQNIFIDKIVKKNGTLIVSQLNFMEFLKMDDPKHAKSTEVFLDRLLPNVYLAAFDIEQVSNFEFQFPEAKLSIPPDLLTLKFLGNRCIALGSKISFEGFIGLFHTNRSSLREASDGATNLILEAFVKLKNDHEFLKTSYKTVPDIARPKTYVIMGELMRDIFLNTNQTIKTNDIYDLQHAVLSINCCDYVLLDGAWEQRVQNMKQRIEKQGIFLKTAKCYSKKNDGINKFLDALEKFKA